MSKQLLPHFLRCRLGLSQDGLLLLIRGHGRQTTAIKNYLKLAPIHTLGYTILILNPCIAFSHAASNLKSLYWLKNKILSRFPVDYLQILLRSGSSLMVGEENGSYVVRRGAHDKHGTWISYRYRYILDGIGQTSRLFRMKRESISRAQNG